MTSVNVLAIGYGRDLFQKGNAERERLRLGASHLRSFHMVIFSLRRHGCVKDRVSDSFTLYPTNSRHALFMLWDAVRVGWRILSRRKTDRWTVTSQDPFAAGVVGYVVARMTGSFFVVQEHGDVFSGKHWVLERPINRVWYRIGLYILRNADRVRTVSQRAATHLKEHGVPEDRIVVLPVLTDIASFASCVPRIDLRARYPQKTPLVLSVARFVKQKNLTMLARAFAAFRQTCPRAQLVIVGRGEEEAVIRGEIARLQLKDSVTILPWTDDVASLMKTADIYALSSHYEGWARVLIEAMACGLPAVTTEVGCVGEVFKDGVHGRAVPVGDEKAFAEALRDIYTDTHLRIRAHESGPGAARDIFADMQDYLQRWAGIYSFGENA